MKNEANYQDLLKTIAIIAMVIDHLGLYFFPEVPIMRVIGRISMPLFCFFAGYNFHNKPKTLVIAAGLILYTITTITFKTFLTTNILIPIYLGQWYIYFYQNHLKKFFYIGYCHIVILAVLWCVTWFLVDYGTIVIAIMALGYIARHDIRNLKLAVLISMTLSLLHTTVTFSLSNIYFGFSNTHIAMTITLSILGYILMTLKDFNEKIIIDVRVLSRNVLYIYCVHLAIIQIAFMYTRPT